MVAVPNFLPPANQSLLTALFGVNVTNFIVLGVAVMKNVKKGADFMKLINFDTKTLILENVRSNEKIIPTSFTTTQYKILCRLIRQKRITKEFFYFLLLELYQLRDWKQMTYEQMYEMIHILTFYNYTTEV
ncbi:MAG: hypothetical protein PUF65_09535 [Lachnospiraceae bacterium]|nr:hypothetical protein [Lachnospiraceae bacterium]